MPGTAFGDRGAPGRANTVSETGVDVDAVNWSAGVAALVGVNVAVIEWGPAVRLLTTIAAVFAAPPATGCAVPMLDEPSLKLTEPAGNVPASAVTLAVKVTGEPSALVAELRSSAVAVE